MPDYILTLIEQVGLILRELAQARRMQKGSLISKICLRETGLPLEIVKRSAPETIFRLLETGGGTQHVRAIVLAELLLEEAKMADPDGKTRDATIARAQARALIAHSLDQLLPEEQTVYRAKLKELDTGFRRGGP